MVNAIATSQDTVYVGGLPGNVVYKYVADKSGNLSFRGNSEPVTDTPSGIKEIVLGDEFIYVCSRGNGYGINVDYKRPDYVASFEDIVGFEAEEISGSVKYEISDEHCPSRWCESLHIYTENGTGSALFHQSVEKTNDNAEFIFWFKSTSYLKGVNIPLIQNVLSVSFDSKGHLGLTIFGKKHFGKISYCGDWLNIKVSVLNGRALLYARGAECPSDWTKCCEVKMPHFEYDSICFGVKSSAPVDIYLDEYAYCDKDIESNSYINGNLTVLERKSLKVVSRYNLDLRCLSMLKRGNLLYLGMIGGLNIYDLSTPSKPELIGIFHDSVGRYWQYPLNGESSYHFKVPGQELQRMDFMVLPDGRKIIGGGCDTHGVLMIDVTCPESPKLFKHLFSTPQVEVKERPEKKGRYIEWGVAFDYPYVYSTVAAVHSLIHSQYYSGKLTAVNPTPDIYGIKVYDISDIDNIRDTLILAPAEYSPSYIAKEGDSCPNQIIRIGNKAYLNFADKGVAVFNLAGFSSSFDDLIETGRPDRIRYLCPYGKDIIAGGGGVWGPWKECNLFLIKKDLPEYGFIAENTAFAMKQVEREIANPNNDVNIVRNPVTISSNGATKYCKYTDWRSGFFPGTLWILYELSGEKKFLTAARKYTEAIDGIQNLTHNHDVGFMTMCSFGNGYRLTGDEHYKDIIIQAAKSLITRFRPNAEIIQSWDEASWHPFKCPVVIDNMMNLELLCKAFELTGDSTFVKVAISHANRTLKEHFREDGSCFHVVDYDSESGTVIKRATFQGYSDESVWSRGQGWVIYGFSRLYQITGNRKYLNQALKTFNMLKNHPTLDADFVPWWDMCDPQIPNAPKDASAAAIIASALYNIATMDVDNPEQYIEYADKILISLSGPAYRASLGENNNFILMHSSGNVPHNSEVDVPLNYADYYFLEALARRKSVLDKKDIPAYYHEYIEKRKQEILPLSLNQADGFFFWTDTHVSSNAMNAPALIGAISQNIKDTKVVWGGDAIPAFVTDIPLYWDIQKRMNASLMQKAKVYNVRGNHEFTCRYEQGGKKGETFSQEMTAALLSESMSEAVRNSDDSGSCYYYFDENNIRYLVFDGTDSIKGVNQPFGTIYGIGRTQLQWMIEEGVLGAPKNTKFVILVHEPVAGDFDAKGHYSEMREVLESVQNHKSTTIYGEKYNFSKRKDLSVILVLAGHMHHDMQAYQNGILHVISCSDAKYNKDFKRSPFLKDAKKRDFGEINEGAFDYVSISKDFSQISFIRIGAGYDRVFNLNPIKIKSGDTVSLQDICRDAVWDIYDSCGNEYVTGPNYSANWILHRDIATVSSDGTVHALKKGEATLVATVDGKQTFYNLEVD